MSRKRILLITAVAAALTAPAPWAAASSGPQSTVYDATVDPVPPSLVSWGLEATASDEFGDEVVLAGTRRHLSSATVTMVTWATQSSYPTWGNASGWSWPVTVNVYEPSADVDAFDLIGSVTEDIQVPWRPEPTVGCADSRWAPNNDPGLGCFSGKAFNADFDLSEIGEVPDKVIITVAYNTATSGKEPTGVSGPADSLNIGLRNISAYGPATAGQDLDDDTVVTDWQTGELGRQSQWAPYTMAFSLTATDGSCRFTTSGNTMTLTDDCVTETSVNVPAGWTLDGAGHTITAIDPEGGHFVGAVVQSQGTGSDVTIEELSVSAHDLANTCHTGVDRLRGILLDGVGGTIEGVTVNGVRQGLSGCQEGNAIEVRNLDGSVPASKAVSVEVLNSTVTDYQKNGITINGNIAATISGNTVDGDGPAPYITQNGVQLGYGASGTVTRNTISDNYYSGSGWTACGLLLYEANGVRQSKNTFVGNQKSLCNYGRGGGQDPTS